MNTIGSGASITSYWKRRSKPRRRWSPVQVGCRVIFPLLVPLWGACKGDGLNQSSPREDPDLYWELALNHRAALLALEPPYNTLSLEATPLNANGEPLSVSATKVTYTSRDVTSVVVSSDGVIHATNTTDPNKPVTVLVTLKVGELTHTDSVMVTVVSLGAAQPPVLTTFRFDPSDSTKIGSQGSSGIIPIVENNLITPFRYHLQAKDIDGADIPNLPVAVRSSDPNIANPVGTSPWWSYPGIGEFTPRLPGRVKLYASTTAFGVSRADTVEYQVRSPAFGVVILSHGQSAAGVDSVIFAPPERKVGVGAFVIFSNNLRTGETSDVTFIDADIPHIVSADSFISLHQPTNHYDPLFLLSSLVDLLFCGGVSHCDGSGNILALPPSTVASDEGEVRAFTEPGIYEFQSNTWGARGRIVVVDEP